MCHKGWAPQIDDKREARLSYMEIGLIEKQTYAHPIRELRANTFLEKLRKVGNKPRGKKEINQKHDMREPREFPQLEEIFVNSQVQESCPIKAFFLLNKIN